MKKLEIFEPELCAADGMCGLSADQEIVRIDKVVKVLQTNLYDINRYVQPDDRQKFMENEKVVNFVREKGANALPLILLDGEIVREGKYPTNDEIAKYLNVPNMAELMK